MSGEKYVTVIPVEYPRTNKYLQPPHPYSDFTEVISDFNDDKQSEFEKPNEVKQEQNNGSSEIHSKNYSLNNSKEFDSDYNMDNSKCLHVCVYLMNDIVLHMELEDGTNTTVLELVDAIINNEELQLPLQANKVFTLWMSSGLLEVQLKSDHEPLMIRSKWTKLLSRFAHSSISRQQRDEPILSFQRNVFFPLSEEEKILDGKILELLYEEAKHNILEGRYPCEISQCILLGGIHARLELGPYNPQFHTNNFFRVHKGKFLSYNAKRDSITSWFRLRTKNSPEFKLLEHFKRIPSSATDKKLQRRYLEICWSLPYYGSAFFQGQIEEPVRGLTSLIMHHDIPVLVGINERGVHIIDNIQAKLLLSLKYEDFSWELANPYKLDNSDSLPCIFLQFMIIENGIRVFKIMQVFSKQAVMMDALINVFVKRIKEKLMNTSSGQDEVDSGMTTVLLICFTVDVRLV